MIVIFLSAHFDSPGPTYWITAPRLMRNGPNFFRSDTSEGHDDTNKQKGSFGIWVGDLSEREKTVSYFGNCKNRRHETAACVSASQVRRIDYRVRVRGCLGPPRTPRTHQSSRLTTPFLSSRRSLDAGAV